MAQRADELDRIRWSPWGAVQTQRTIADGLIFVSTASHGGISVSPTRWERLLELLPTFRAFGDRNGWLEEDCDYGAAIVCWPEEFNDAECWSAWKYRDGCYAGVFRHAGPEWTNCGTRQRLIDAAERYEREHGADWLAGSKMTTAGGWTVSFRQISSGEQRWIVMPDYPERVRYSTAELDAMECEVPA